jgi:hypothetical protein
VRLVERRPGLLNDPAAWAGLTETTAAALVKAAAVDGRSIVAGIGAGHGDDVLRAAGPAAVARAIAHDGTYADATDLLAGIEPRELARDRTDDRVVLLLVALFGQAQVDADLPARLERCRGRADDLWLRAAVEAITSTVLPHSEALTVAFEPLHDAITADRLPRECWNQLDDVLPQAPDPALRLRQHLLAIAEEEQWTGERFERALRGAGPYAGQLLHDFSDGDDWWVASDSSDYSRRRRVVRRTPIAGETDSQDPRAKRPPKTLLPSLHRAALLSDRAPRRRAAMRKGPAVRERGANRAGAGGRVRPLRASG